MIFTSSCLMAQWLTTCRRLTSSTIAICDWLLSLYRAMRTKACSSRWGTILSAMSGHP